MKPPALRFDFLPRPRAQRLGTTALWAGAGLAWAAWALAWGLTLTTAEPDAELTTTQAPLTPRPDPLWTTLWPRLELLAQSGVSVEALQVDSSRNQAQLELLLQSPQLLHSVLAAQQAAAPGQVQLLEQSPVEGQATGSRAQLSLQW